MKKYIHLIILFCLGSVYLHAQPCDSGSAYMTLTGSNYEAPILSGGNLWSKDALPDIHEPYEDRNGYQFPINSEEYIFNNGGLFITGKDQQGNTVGALPRLIASGEITGSDFFPGPLNAAGDPLSGNCKRYDMLWKVEREAIEAHKDHAVQYDVGGGGKIPVGLIPRGIRTWPAGNNPFALDATGSPMQVDLLPWIDYNNDGQYDPRDGDYPDVDGDQSIWTIYNSAIEPHKTTGGQPVNIEVIQQVYGFDTSGILGNTSFYAFEIRNRGPRLDSVYLGLHMYAAFGFPYSRARYDSATNSAYFTSAFANDTNPAMAGVTCLQGPLQYTYSSGGAPIDSMRLEQSQLSDGGGVHVNDDSLYLRAARNGRAIGTDTCAALFRGHLTAGPISMKAGDVQHLKYAVVAKLCEPYTNLCPEFNCIRQAVDSVHLLTTGNSPIGWEPGPEKAHDVTAYPNPASDNIFININGIHDLDAGKAQLINMNGGIVETFEVNERNETLNVSHLPDGVYLLQIRHSSYYFSPRKIIIAK